VEDINAVSGETSEGMGRAEDALSDLAVQTTALKDLIAELRQG